MSSYIKSTDFAIKDSLLSGDPLKTVSGTEINIELNNVQVAVNTKANLNSPVFTGVPTAPTASPISSSTQIASTAFVQANKVSPAFTGIPTAPSATLGTATNQLATTLFVNSTLNSLPSYALLTDATQNITANNIVANNLVADQLAVTAEGLYLTQAKTGFRIYQSGTTLYIAYNGDNIFTLSSTGAVVADSSITANDTIA
jgi:hypothetical protein